MDGKLVVTTGAHMVVGTILREVGSDGTTPQFGDSVIVRVHHELTEQGAQVFLSRPHLIVTNSGAAYVRMEEYSAYTKKLCGEKSIFRTVCLNSGACATVAVKY